MYEKFLDSREKRRLRADAAASDRLDRRFDEAEALVGQLMREGKLVYYLNVRTRRGKLTGEIITFPTHWDAVQYALAKRYV